MCQGRERLEFYMRDYKKRSDTLTNKEQDVLKDMKIVQEMYARGFEFLPLDIYTAKADKFQIIDGKLMPPLNSIEGMGDKAAEAVEDAVETVAEKTEEAVEAAAEKVEEAAEEAKTE